MHKDEFHIVYITFFIQKSNNFRFTLTIKTYQGDQNKIYLATRRAWDNYPSGPLTKNCIYLRTVSTMLNSRKYYTSPICNQINQPKLLSREVKN